MKFVVGTNEYQINRADIAITANSTNFTATSYDSTIDIVEMDAAIRPIISTGFKVVNGSVEKTYVGFTLNTIRETIDEQGVMTIIVDCYKENN